MAIGFSLKSWTKYLNIFIFLVALVTFLLFKDTLHISTNLVSFLPNCKSKELFEIYSEFKNAKEVFIAVEGFDKEALAKIKNIENRFLKTGVLRHESDIKPNQALNDYTKKYKFFIEELVPEDSTAISQKLKLVYENILTSSHYNPLDTQDPLDYFQPKKQNFNIQTRDGHLVLGDYGYLSIFSLVSTENTLENYQNIYTLLKQESSNIENIKLFSPIFYYVQNAQKIQEDVNFLIILSTGILLLLYSVIIKNSYLLLNTILTLITSTLFSFFILSLFWSEISVFVLAFGGAIGTVAIDYMFHHYLHGHYEQKEKFNSSVFFGFLTTSGGFFIFSFINFPLIQQLCVFSILSLLISYLHFAFIYPLIGFKKAPTFSIVKFSMPLHYKTIAIFSLLIIILCVPFLTLDTNIKNLDSQNKNLMADEAFFKDQMQKKNYTPILIEATSIDSLIANCRAITKDFEHSIVPLSYLLDKKSYIMREKVLANLNFEEIKTKLQEEATALGFRKNFFDTAYSQTLIKAPFSSVKSETLSDMGFDVVFQNEKYFTYGLVKNFALPAMTKIDYVHNMDAKSMFLNALQSINHQLILSGILNICLIFGTLAIVCRQSFALSASYVLFPTALILLFCLRGDINIIHLFMLFIVMAISIDYGIYMADKHSENTVTKNAILFSLVSTFAGFGVLAWSDIGALYSIGFVACIGIVAIFILLMGRKSR